MQNSVVRQFPLAELEVGAQSFTPTHLHSLNQNRSTHPSTRTPNHTPTMSMAEDVWFPWLKNGGRVTQPASKTSTNIGVVRRQKGGASAGVQLKKSGKIRGKLPTTPPARRVWRCCDPFYRRPHDGRGWHGREVEALPFTRGKRLSAGYTETGIVGKIHLDIIMITTTLLY